MLFNSICLKASYLLGPQHSLINVSRSECNLLLVTTVIFLLNCWLILTKYWLGNRWDDWVCKAGLHVFKQVSSDSFFRLGEMESSWLLHIRWVLFPSFEQIITFVVIAGIFNSSSCSLTCLVLAVRVSLCSGGFHCFRGYTIICLKKVCQGTSNYGCIWICFQNRELL